MEIHELWDEPWEGLPEEEEAWGWDKVSKEEKGRHKTHPTGREVGNGGISSITSLSARMLK
jgi:hypothetical protein